MNAAGRRRFENNGRLWPDQARREGLRRRASATKAGHYFTRWIMRGLLGHEGSTDRTDEEQRLLLDLSARVASGYPVDLIGARASGFSPYAPTWPVPTGPVRAEDCQVCGERVLEPFIGCAGFCRSGLYALGVVP